MLDLEEVKARLRDLATEMTQAALAKEIGVSPQMLSMALSGRRRISHKMLEYLGYRKVTRYEEVS
jgi:transcriptional regulator with XRE-family HTH domain